MGKRASIAAAVDEVITSIEGKTILDRCQENPALAMKVLNCLLPSPQPCRLNGHRRRGA